MTQEEKQLLLKVLCTMLPYGVILQVTLIDKYDKRVTRDIELNAHNISMILSNSNWLDWKPYLRPLSSMTEEEVEEFKALIGYEEMLNSWIRCNKLFGSYGINLLGCSDVFDWLNKKMFDYRDLIPHNLAIEVTKENNPYSYTQ